MTILILFLKYLKFASGVKQMNYCPGSAENLQIWPKCCIILVDWMILKPDFVLI